MVSDGGGRPPSAYRMESNGGGCLSGAIVSYREHGGRMLLRPYTDVRQWPMSFVRPRNVFRLRRMPVGRYCSLPGRSGAYAIRPYTDVRQWPLSFVRPRNGFPIAADACRALLFPAGNMGGRMQYAPTRAFDNGRCRSFTPVGNHFMGHRVPSAGRVGAYCIRPFKCPRRGQIRRRRSTPIRL